PLKWNAEAARLGVRYRVFCASLADVFDNEAPQRWRQNLMSLVADTPHLDWLYLTKRIGNAGKMLRDASMHDARLLTAHDHYAAPDNLWIGATVCNQEEADRDIPKLLQVPAAKRFLSIEPLLGPVDLTQLLYHPCPRAHLAGIDPDTGTQECCKACDYSGISEELGIDWIIAGGESGSDARPMHPDWARSLRDQCQAAGVPFLFKQWGEFFPKSNHPGLTEPNQNPNLMIRVGKKAAGRLLDGRTWDEVPA
ncbi:DUF5131 family protein, partial [Leptospira sp. 96542]|nr:DUF5131 family protein [Leptospira sp. 96542]